jgi:hypothetical protein
MKNILILGVLAAVGFFVAYQMSPDLRRATDETISAAHIGPGSDGLTSATSTVFKKVGSGQ